MGEEKLTAVGHWLIKAEHDFEMAQRALEREPIITDMACFHAQQCAEKSLKAFLVFMDSHVDQIHDLGKLAGKCGILDGSFSELHPLVAGMTRYAVKDRYTDDWREILLDEARDALGKAEKVMAFVKRKIKAQQV